MGVPHTLEQPPTDLGCNPHGFSNWIMGTFF